MAEGSLPMFVCFTDVFCPFLRNLSDKCTEGRTQCTVVLLVFTFALMVSPD